MKHETQDFEIHASASDAYEQLAGERRRTLVGPEDDMWAAFADRAEPYALMVGAKLVGRFSVDVESQVHGFYVSEEFEAVAAELFVRVVDEMSISAAMASTVDPLCLGPSRRASSGRLRTARSSRPRRCAACRFQIAPSGGAATGTCWSIS
jgi:hypothetical protein